jgi:shikimate dehydrogenase
VIGGTTRVGAVIGWPVDHSRSPALHNAAFAALGIDAVFVALPVQPARLPAALRGMAALGFLGASVTVPHKQACRDLCDRLDAAAEAIGAVNCVAFARDELVGHNTDAAGFVDALAAELGRGARGARAVLLGAGGAARAVAHGLASAGAAAVTVVARRAADWCPVRGWDELAGLAGGADLLIDCTSAALGGQPYPAPVPLEALPGGAAVVSLMYGRPQPLLEAARARGLAAMDGAAMLVHQGARAFTIWTGRPAPVDAMRAAMEAAA